MEELFNYHRFFVVIIDTIAIWLLIVVMLTNWKKTVGKLYLLMTISMLVWVNFAYLARIVESSESAIVLLKIGWLGTLPFNLFIYLFALALLGQWGRYKYLTRINVILVVIVNIFTIFTGLVIDSVRYREGFLGINYGPGMLPFLGVTVLLIVSTIYVFFRNYRSLDTEARTSARAFVIGLSVFYVFNVIFNVLLPVFFDITRYYFFGDYSTLVLMSAIAYSIVRYRFLNIKFALSSFLVSLIGMFLVVDIILLSASLAEQLFKLLAFIVYLLVGGLLIKSIFNEADQREKLEKVNRELESTTESLAIELKHTEELKNKIEEAYNKERDMMDILGHELRTPLTVARNAILMMDNELQKPDPNMATIKDYIEKSKENIRREIKTLQTVLSTTRLENNRSQINFEKVDLRDVVNDSLEAFGLDAVEKGLEVNLVMPPEGDLDVWGGREQVQEIMDNLLSNAVKYTAKGKIRVMVERSGQFLKMSVADTGEGIPEEEMKNLGKKFHRVNPYVDNHSNGANLSVVRPGGTGIGLYVVTGFLNAMGGSLEVQSEVGKGSNFIAVMPIYNGQDALRKQSQRSVSVN